MYAKQLKSKRSTRHNNVVSEMWVITSKKATVQYMQVASLSSLVGQSPAWPCPWLLDSRGAFVFTLPLLSTVQQTTHSAFPMGLRCQKGVNYLVASAPFRQGAQ
jgi:hypothetical protein